MNRLIKNFYFSFPNMVALYQTYKFMEVKVLERKELGELSEFQLFCKDVINSNEKTNPSLWWTMFATAEFDPEIHGFVISSLDEMYKKQL